MMKLFFRNDPKPGLPIRVHYFLRVPNVGDRVSPLLVSALSGFPARYSAGTDRPHLLAAGSLMAGAAPKTLVWGTGVMHPEFGLGSAKKRNIYAVRGRLSADLLARHKLISRNVALGDPGLLAPKLLGIAAAREPEFQLGVCAHYVDRYHPAVRRLLALPGVCDLDVRKDPADFLGAMAKCRAVASSSLHGLIFAEALELPTHWFTASGEVAGSDFKFHDWFSTTSNPQPHPSRFNGSEDPEQLAGSAERRYSGVRVEELEGAFPRQRLAEMQDPRPVTAPAIVSQRAARPLPVFIISFNRGALLQRCLAGLRHLSRPTVPVIHDNGSTDAATLRVLSDLEGCGVRVVRGPAITSADALNDVDQTVADYFSDWREPSRYAVTDCDIDLSVADPAALDVYDELLDIVRKAGCVGPMLRIRDINPSYPLHARVMNRHIELLWQHRPSWVDTTRGRIAFQDFRIDTTFALHRAGEPFRRLKSAVRVYEPYEALHLDWYEEARTLDQSYLGTSHPSISHWNNKTVESLNRDERLRYEQFHAVRRTANGDLEEYVCKVTS